MELAFSKRGLDKKLEVKRARRKGEIPGILYCRGKKGETIIVDANEFKKLIRKIPQGFLSTTVFTLKSEEKVYKAILKDVQYNVTSYEPIHLDFEELKADEKVTVNVPIQCTGVAECAGVKLGGVLKQIKRTVRVKCLSDAIPSHFELDVKELTMGHVKRLGDIAFPDGVEPIGDMKTAAIVIGKQK